MKRLVFALSLAAAFACGDNTREPVAPPADDPPKPEDGFRVSDASVDAPVLFDRTKDNDGDGWLFVDDCDDLQINVNPGAVEYLGDGVDNDCDGTVDRTTECDDKVDPDAYAATDPYAYARAIGLCKRATEEGRDWGLLSAEMLLHDGEPREENTEVQMGILQSFGPNVKPRHGKNMAVLSSGTARTPADLGFSKEWAANQEYEKINDSINLKLRIRVPTNALSFSIDYSFYSAEYPQYVGTQFNDEFLAVLETKVPLSKQAKRSIALDAYGNVVSVNSGFFEVCIPTEAGGKFFDCPLGTDELVGTGREKGGATSWLRTKGPVMSGEIITLQLMIFDVSDHALDSTILIDNWLWEATASEPGTTRPPR